VSLLIAFTVFISFPSPDRPHFYPAVASHQHTTCDLFSSQFHVPDIHSQLCSASIIVIHVITFMQAIYNYIPDTNRVCTVYSVAAVLYLQSALHVALFRA
jgi:hypothetical protein